MNKPLNNVPFADLQQLILDSFRVGVNELTGYRTRPNLPSKTRQTPAEKTHLPPKNHYQVITQPGAGPYSLANIFSNGIYVRGTIHENKPGIPLTLKFKLIDLDHDNRPLAAAAIYLWHGDNNGVYASHSLTDIESSKSTFCRGLQDVNHLGEVTFHTIYPGNGVDSRGHLNVQVFVYDGAGPATSATLTINLLTETGTSQMRRSRSRVDINGLGGKNAGQPSAQVSGSLDEGFTATLTIGVTVQR
ncbi:peptidase associated/transthyretin-like domain-containing protein [Gilvimarinus agarilyticus]|uniref:hypothetical protein n=1 Tax=Gilvimarinus agarilyticus TaxID=679259 RepID=UPI0012F7A56E|nr:hypothetical protein [Gilvimarinus agarilyticus]